MNQGSSAQPLPILISQQLKTKLDYYIQQCPVEISGLGIVRSDHQSLWIEEIHLSKQTCGAADTIIEPAAVMDYMSELIARGEEPKFARLWWHSHVKMPVHWSGTDDHNIQQLGAQGADWIVSILGNHMGEYSARLDVFSPIAHTVPARLVVYQVQDDELLAQVKAEIAEKVTVKKFVPPKTKPKSTRISTTPPRSRSRLFDLLPPRTVPESFIDSFEDDDLGDELLLSPEEIEHLLDPPEPKDTEGA